MAERPLECGHCKRSIKVIYKELVGDSLVVTEMCEECPILQAKLHGQARSPSGENTPGLACGQCGTTLEAVQTENPLGCSTCYTVFADVLITKFMHSDEIPPSLKKSLEAKKTQSLHMGKSPNALVTITPSSRLTALNDALNEALKKENFEQAALLRDQIKALKENENERKN